MIAACSFTQLLPLSAPPVQLLAHFPVEKNIQVLPCHDPRNSSENQTNILHERDIELWTNWSCTKECCGLSSWGQTSIKSLSRIDWQYKELLDMQTSKKQAKHQFVIAWSSFPTVHVPDDISKKIHENPIFTTSNCWWILSIQRFPARPLSHVLLAPQATPTPRWDRTGGLSTKGRIGPFHVG